MLTLIFNYLTYLERFLLISKYEITMLPCTSISEKVNFYDLHTEDGIGKCLQKISVISNGLEDFLQDDTKAMVKLDYSKFFSKFQKCKQ